MPKFTIKNYRNTITLALVFVSVGFFLGACVILVQALVAFFGNLKTQFYGDYASCPETTYTSYLPSIRTIQIIFNVMIAISTLCCLITIITLQICYRRQNQSNSIKCLKLHKTQIILIMISIITGICALLHLITLYTEITKLQTDTQNTQTLHIITSKCFPTTTYQLFLDKLQILFTMIILLCVFIALLLLSLLFVGWIVIKSRYLKPIKQVKPRLTAIIENKIQKIMMDFNHQVSQNSLYPIRTESEEKIQKICEEIGVGGDLVLGDGVDVAIQTFRVSLKDYSTNTKVQVSHYGCGQDPIYEQQLEEEQEVETVGEKQQKLQIAKSQFHRTQLSQYHMTHGQQIRVSKLRKQPQKIPQQKKQRRVMDGYYFQDSETDKSDSQNIHLSVPKLQPNQNTDSIRVAQNRLPYNVHINRQFIDNHTPLQTPKSNHNRLKSSKSQQSLLDSLIRIRNQKMMWRSRKKIFQPINYSSKSYVPHRKR